MPPWSSTRAQRDGLEPGNVLAIHRQGKDRGDQEQGKDAEALALRAT
jgi:hypothetical protein